jgi:outer membrane receptor protein involved in Fe transport
MGVQPAYGLLDLTFGASFNQSTLQFVVTNATDRRAQLSRFTQTAPPADNQIYIIPAQPRTLAIKFGQKF